MMSNRYCTNCGAPIVEGNRFCGKCGQPLQSPPSPGPHPPQPQPAPRRRTAPPTPSEQILGIVAVGKPKGLLGMRQDSYNLIVTPTRLVFAYVSPALMKEAVKRAREEAKQQGKGFLGQWGAQLAWLDVLHRQYRKMTMDAILAHYAGSFAIPNHQVQKVRYKQNYDQESGKSSDELILRTVDGKLHLKLLTGNLGQVKQLLRQSLGGVA